MSGFHTGFIEMGGNSWLTYLVSTFGRLEMSHIPFEQVLGGGGGGGCKCKWANSNLYNNVLDQ